MKKTTYTLIAIILLFIAGNTAFAQTENITNTNKLVQKLNKKVKGSSVKKFGKVYPGACADMENLVAEAPKSEFGYDVIAKNVKKWIYIHNTLNKNFADGPLVFKKLSIDLNYVDYEPLMIESKKKAAKAHFDAANKIFSEEKDYQKRLESIKHFKDARNLANDEDKETIYASSIGDEKEKEIHYDEGIRLLKEGKTFDEKLQSEVILKKISKYKEYKDVSVKMSELYYAQGVKLLASSDVKEVIKAQKYFATISKSYDKAYKDIVAKNNQACEKVAGIYYREAFGLEKVQTFEGQAIAAAKYKTVLSWVTDYKDANARMSTCNSRAKARIICVKADGGTYMGNDLRDASNIRIDAKFKDYMSIPIVSSDLSGIDMNDNANFAKAKDKLGYGFLVLKVGRSGNVSYSLEAPTSTTKEIDAYYATVKKSDGTWGKRERSDKAEVRTLEITVNAGATTLHPNDEAAQQKYIKDNLIVEEYHGELTTNKVSAKAEKIIYIELWDYRLGRAEKIGEYASAIKSSSYDTWQTYTGDDGAKPSSLAVEGGLKSESELTDAVKDKTKTLQSAVKESAYDIASMISKKVTFK